MNDNIFYYKFWIRQSKNKLKTAIIGKFQNNEEYKKDESHTKVLKNKIQNNKWKHVFYGSEKHVKNSLYWTMSQFKTEIEILENNLRNLAIYTKFYAFT